MLNLFSAWVNFFRFPGSRPGTSWRLVHSDHAPAMTRAGAVDPVDAGEQTNGQLNARNAARSLPAAEVELWDRSVPHRRTRRRARHRRVVVPHRDPAARLEHDLRFSSTATACRG
jgi:hypothetical protein